MIEKFESVGGTIVLIPMYAPLWEDKLECQRTINAFIPKAHIVKISDEELLFITGKKNEDEAIQSLFRGQVNVVIYTQGAQGATILPKMIIVFIMRGIKFKQLIQLVLVTHL